MHDHRQIHSGVARGPTLLHAGDAEQEQEIRGSARDALEGKNPRTRDLMRRIWPHALGVAVMAADLYHTFNEHDRAAAAYVAGLESERRCY